MTLTAVLFDRDGTLVEDVPYNGDPAKVFPLQGAIAAVRETRSRGLRTGVITNQSGIARGIVERRQVGRVNQQIDILFGAFDVWCICPHGPTDGCNCRKPAPGLVLEGSARLGTAVGDVLVVGDRAADLGAARAAGATGVLVPSSDTEPEAYEAAPIRLRTISDLIGVLDLQLRGPK